MAIESLFRIAFWIIFGEMTVMQTYFALQVRLSGEQKATDRGEIEREGWGHALVTAMGRSRKRN